jgi:hypothetical protein
MSLRGKQWRRGGKQPPPWREHARTRRGRAGQIKNITGGQDAAHRCAHQLDRPDRDHFLFEPRRKWIRTNRLRRRDASAPLEMPSDPLRVRCNSFLLGQSGASEPSWLKLLMEGAKKLLSSSRAATLWFSRHRREATLALHGHGRRGRPRQCASAVGFLCRGPRHVVEAISSCLGPALRGSELAKTPGRRLFRYDQGCLYIMCLTKCPRATHLFRGCSTSAFFDRLPSDSCFNLQFCRTSLDPRRKKNRRQLLNI